MTDSFRFHLFGQVHLEQPSVPSVCSEDGVRNIAEQRNQTQAEVEHDVEHHPRSESRRQATVDFLTRFDYHQGHEAVDEVANAEAAVSLVDPEASIFREQAYTGMMPMTLLQPKRIPQQLNSDMSRR